MIEYILKKNKKHLQVCLDGKICGEIREVTGGYQYFPKGSKVGGDVYPTLEEVKHSLESD